MSGFLTLHEAAEQLGVHYMTAYRYVRLGQLAAHKEGGTWRVSLDDLRVFQHSDAGSSSRSTSRRNVSWWERFENRLLEGDATGAWRVLEGALTAGSSPLGIYSDVIVPALESIGGRWANGEIGVADEHQASLVTARLMGRLSPSFSRRGRRKGTVVVAGPPGERHFLNLAMVADALRVGGYDVVELGTDLPLDDFESALGLHLPVKGVCVGVLNPGALDAARLMVATARRVIAGTVPVVLGGGAIADERHAVGLGADRCAELVTVVEAVEAGRRIVSAVSV